MDPEPDEPPSDLVDFLVGLFAVCGVLIAMLCMLVLAVTS